MKKALIIAIVLLIIGGAIFLSAYFATGRDLSKLSIEKCVTNEYTLAEEFQNIELSTKESDVAFFPSTDGTTRVVCKEKEHVKHSVTVEEGTLKITAKNTEKWYERFTLFGGPSLYVKIYLPVGVYGTLSIKASTGDVDLPEGFSFESVYVKASTGDVKCASSSAGDITIKTSTGNIVLANIASERVDLAASTGDIKVTNLACVGDLSAKVSTGKVRMDSVTCKNATIGASTGNVIMKNVIASEMMSIKTSTGDVSFDHSDAGEISVKVDTGDVKGSLRSAKVFIVRSDTGRINVPESLTGGKCKIETDTGDIKITIESVE